MPLARGSGGGFDPTVGTVGWDEASRCDGFSASADSSPATARPFAGSFDELAVFERALGAGVIADLAKAATPKPSR